MAIIDYIDLKIDQLADAELAKISQDFRSHALAAIQGNPETLAMYPSYIIKQQTPLASKLVLAIDLGGSHIRLGLYHSLNNVVEQFPQTSVVSTEYKGQELTLENYVGFLTTFVKNFLDQNSQLKIDAIGLVFSYPAKIVKHEDHIDISREGFGDDWGKGFVVKNSSVNITDFIKAEFAKQGMVFPFWVSLNDVAALILAEPEADLSLVVGTGFNIGVTDANKMIYNSESAFFKNSVIEATFSKPAKMYVDDLKQKLESMKITEAESSDLKKASEIQVGGGYIYKLLLYAMAIVGERNLILFQVLSKLESQSIALILNKDFDGLEAKIGVKLSNTQRENFYHICAKLIERSTDIVAAELAGAASISGNTNSLTIAADGSVIRNFPGFIQMVEKKLAKISGINTVKLNLVENSALVGAAVAAMSTLRT